MSSRVTRLFINFTVFTPTTEVLMGMYGRNIQHWLEEFPTYSVDHHFELSRVRGIAQRLKVKATYTLFRNLHKILPCWTYMKKKWMRDPILYKIVFYLRKDLKDFDNQIGFWLLGFKTLLISLTRSYISFCVNNHLSFYRQWPSAC